MAIDPSIPLQGQAPKFNDPFSVLANMQQVRQQQQLGQQQLASNQALEQERRAKLAEDAKKQQEADNFNKIIGNPDLTPEKFLETVRTQAPEHYLAAKEAIEKGQKSVADLQKVQAEAADAQAKVQTASQDYSANLARMVSAQGNTPTAFELAMKLHEQAFPQSQTPSQLRDYVRQNGPDSIKALTDGLMTAADKTASVELPGKAAVAQQQQQVTAGMQGGPMTAEQRAQLGQGGQRIGLEAAGQAETRRHNLVNEQAAAPPDYGSGTGPTPTPQSGQRNEAFLATLPTALADKVKALVEGRLQLPSRFTKGDTYWQGILDAAVKYDPSFDAVNYNARNKTRADFTSGASSKQVQNMNAAIGHLAALDDASKKLIDVGFTPANYVANKLAGTVSPAVNTFNTVTHRVAPELVQAYRGSGGAEADIVNNMKDFSIGNTHEMNHDAIAKSAELLGSLISSLDTKYQQGMGTDAVKVLSPASQATLDRLQGKSGSKPSKATGTADLVWDPATKTFKKAGS